MHKIQTAVDENGTPTKASNFLSYPNRRWGAGEQPPGHGISSAGRSFIVNKKKKKKSEEAFVCLLWRVWLQSEVLLSWETSVQSTRAGRSVQPVSPPQRPGNGILFVFLAFSLMGGETAVEDETTPSFESYVRARWYCGMCLKPSCCFAPEHARTHTLRESEASTVRRRWARTVTCPVNCIAEDWSSRMRNPSYTA